MAACLTIATKVLLVTVVTLTAAPTNHGVALTAMLALGAAGVACVAVVMHDVLDPVRATDLYAVALGLTLVAQASLVLLVPTMALDGPERLLLGGVLAMPVVAVLLVVLLGTFGTRLSALLVATAAVTLAGVGLEVVRPDVSAWVMAVALPRTLLGAAWLGIGWGCLRRVIEEDRRHMAEIDLARSITRTHQEQLHELRSTVAGLVNGSEILDHSEITMEARQHVWQSVRRELDRLQRMLSDHESPATDLDLDETLQVILELQRLKGRRVELLGSGATVRAHYDWLAEVVNILLDNASVHGGSDATRVEVVRRDDDTVDISVTDFGCGIPADQREQIFGWGVRGDRSPGQGIGLNVARRLVTRDGGALRLSDRDEKGSTFVISLPSPRTAMENHVASGR